MKKLFFIILLMLFTVTNASSKIYYIKHDVETPKIKLLIGTPMKKGPGNSFVTKGFAKHSDLTTLYSDKNFSLKVAIIKDVSVIKVVNENNKYREVVLTANVSANNLTQEPIDVWGDVSDLFLDLCSQCHAIPETNKHTMLEWDAIFSTMRKFANPTKEDGEKIIRFLKSFAKDGFLKEEDVFN